MISQAVLDRLQGQINLSFNSRLDLLYGAVVLVPKVLPWLMPDSTDWDRVYRPKRANSYQRRRARKPSLYRRCS